MKFRILLCVPVLAGLVACQFSAVAGKGYSGSSVGAGTKLELPEALPVPAGKARVYLQAGEVLAYSAIDQYQPFCYFLMRGPSPLARIIQPTTFVVREVERREQYVRLTSPVRFAGRGVFAGGDGPGVIAFETHMRLDGSGKQLPERLVCSGAFAPPYEAVSITLTQMRQTLGSRVFVRVPELPGR